MSNAIQPIMDAAVSITIAGTSASAALPQGYDTFRLHNGASETIYLQSGGSSVAATASATGNMTLPSGAIEIVTIQTGDDTHLAAIGTGSTGVLSITPCTGGV